MPRSAFVALALSLALTSSGCGSPTSCPKETPGINAVQSCTVEPGALVTVQVRTCATCNQTAPSCSVDLSQLGSGQIFLDPQAEVCEPVTSCETPSCGFAPVDCSFSAPSTPGPYTLVAFDPSTNSSRTGTLTVASGPSSCAFSLR